MAQKPTSPRQASYLKALAEQTGESFNPVALKLSVAAHYEITRLKALVDTKEKIVAVSKKRDFDRIVADEVGVQVFAFEIQEGDGDPDCSGSEVTEGSFSEISFDHTPHDRPTFSDDQDRWGYDPMGIMSESPRDRMKRLREEANATTFYCG